MIRVNLVVAIIAILIALGIIPVSAEPFLRHDLIGVWAYEEAVTTHPGRPSTYEYGRKPQGLFIILRNGRYSHIVMQSDKWRVKGGTIKSATPDENKRLAQRNLSHFGTYTADEKGGTFTVSIEGSSFPNFEGVKQTRTIIALTNDRLEYINPVSAAGSGAKVRAVLRRVD